MGLRNGVLTLFLLLSCTPCGAFLSRAPWGQRERASGAFSCSAVSRKTPLLDDDDAITRLKDHYRTSGSSIVDYEDDKDLYNWCVSMRERYGAAAARKKCPKDHLEQLTQIRFAWNSKELRWQKRFSELKQFQKEHGHCHVPSRDYPTLARWVFFQRKAYKKYLRGEKSSSHQEKIEALESIGFEQHGRYIILNKTLSKLDVNKMIGRLENYYHEHGTSIVRLGDDEELHRWCEFIRRKHRFAKARRKLPMARLEQIGFVWNSTEANWQQHFHELKLFQREHGHCQISSHDHPTLSQWAHIQRGEYKKYLEGETSSLSRKWVGALESIGSEEFCPDKCWDVMMTKLEAFHKEHGHSQVGHSDPRLAKWCERVRDMHGDASWSPSKSLEPEQFDQLERVNFVWDLPDDEWMSNLDEICAFRAEHGHCNVPKEQTRLWQWGEKLRREYILYNRGEPSRLTPQRVEALQALGLTETFRSKPDVWNLRYKELKAFYQVHGHSNVPEIYPDNQQLGLWVANQRSKYHKHNGKTLLNEERIAALEKLDFQWDMFNKRWQSMLEQLDEYQENHGNITIIKNYEMNYELASWLSTQRRSYKVKMNNLGSSSLNEQRQAALEAIPGFEWVIWTREKDDGNDDDGDGDVTEEGWSSLVENLREQDLSLETYMQSQTREDDGKDMYTDDDIMALWNSEED